MDIEKLTHDDLINIGRNWLLKSFCNGSKEYGHSPCSVVLTELYANTKYGEQPDILGFNSNCRSRSILIECKVSRSDFYADQKKPFRHEVLTEGIGSQRWYLAPEGIIPKDKVPEKWGLLEVTQNKKVKVIKYPIIQKRDYESEINMIISTVRRLNILPDDHIAISKYIPLTENSKKKATFYIEEEN
ncbi:MAG: hypothetical protein FWB95_02670 [Treponema sp.]|nr:hypothetical protein [Treponema sp.]